MAKVMSLSDLKNKVSRDGFDLSVNQTFTAKTGELLPVKVIPVLPDDKLNIDLGHFTRTMPLNTAAYTEVTEYFDVFFVPYNILWDNFNNFWNNREGQNMTKAKSLTGSVDPIQYMPYCSLSYLNGYLADAKLDKVNNKSAFGFNRADLSAKLFTYLGLGDFLDYTRGDYSFNRFLTSSFFNPKVSLSPIAAYQKIYQDHFRFDQWEKLAAYRYEFSYVTSTATADVSTQVAGLHDSTNGLKSLQANMFDLNYVNYERDLFFGVYPDSQLGDEAVVTVGQAGTPVVTSFKTSTSSYLVGSGITDGATASLFKDSTGYYHLAEASQPSRKLSISFNQSEVNTLRKALGFSDSSTSSVGFSILQLRLAQVLQRYREITQSGNYDLKSQMKKIWNVEVPNFMAGLSYRVGGYSSNLSIQEVVNNNLAESSYQADIAGKGVGSSGRFVKFDCSKYGNMPGILMITYYNRPKLVYSTTRLELPFQLLTIDDFANPVFDKLGMEQVHLFDLSAGKALESKLSGVPAENLFIGYAPRYIKWKTDVNRAFGGFAVAGLQHWVPSVGDDYVAKWISKAGSSGKEYLVYNYNLFKVNPSFIDPLFYTVTDSTVKTDRFLINLDLDIKAVRSLSYDGMPY